jgi:hypothetical protein
MNPWDYDLRVVQLNDVHYRLYPAGPDEPYWQLHHNGTTWNVWDDNGECGQSHQDRDLGFASVLGEPMEGEYDDTQAHLLTHAAALGGWMSASYCESHHMAEGTDRLVYWGLLVHETAGTYRLTAKGRHEAARLAG